MVSVPQKMVRVQRWDLVLVAGFFFSFLTTEEINQFSCACLACARNKIDIWIPSPSVVHLTSFLIFL